MPNRQPKKLSIIGAGIAGLCAGVYAKQAGYDVEIFEMGRVPGGLATNWKRGEYTFETCIHWLVGSNPKSLFHAWWKELFDIDKIRFHEGPEFSRLETEDGQVLVVYRDVDRMEQEFLRYAPEDTLEIRKFAKTIRTFSRIELPAASEFDLKNLIRILKIIPHLPALRQWSKLTLAEYAARYRNPLLRKFFGGGLTELSAIAIVFSLVWMNQRDAGYPIGGSPSFIRPLVDRFTAMGGQIHYRKKVEKILVENDRAIGIQLVDGEKVFSDWVISAADGHATIFEMLDGKYRDPRIDTIYRDFKPFPSYFQISFGIADPLQNQPENLSLILKKPFELDPQTHCEQLSFRFFNFDPTMAPLGKTAVTCFIPTDNWEYWVNLRRQDKDRYRSEKMRLANYVLDTLERRIPGIRAKVEQTDISTPATVIRYTGNWRGSMEGWLLTPKTGLSPLSNKLPGLEGFRLIGQWIAPGGGIPSGLITARTVIRELSKKHFVPFG